MVFSGFIVIHLFNKLQPRHTHSDSLFEVYASPDAKYIICATVDGNCSLLKKGN